MTDTMTNAEFASVTADELRSFVERIEQIAAEKSDLSEADKEVAAEAKGRGYCVKTLRRIVALRKRNADDIAEAEAIEALYRSALGMP